MDRYTVETVDPYDMEPAPDGMWVMHDDAQAAIAAAVTAERERAACVAESWQDYRVVPASLGPRIAAAIRAIKT